MTPPQASQHSIGSGDYMVTPGDTYEIRQAMMVVHELDKCLRMIQDIAGKYSTHIVCFNADNMAGRAHAEAAILHAQRSMVSKKPISNSFEMEALLFAAGSRQCSFASVFGIHEGENSMYVCTCPVKEVVWQALSLQMEFVREPWDDLSEYKIARLMSLFDITRDELEVVGREKITDLIYERIALLAVYR